MSDKKVIMIMINDDGITYNHRKELLQAIIDKGHTVVIVLPYGKRVEALKKMGCIFIDVPMLERRGMNPAKDFKLFMYYRKIISQIKPDIIFGFTIKPNTYGAIAARQYKVPFVAAITGLGTALVSKNTYGGGGDCSRKFF